MGPAGSAGGRAMPPQLAPCGSKSEGVVAIVATEAIVAMDLAGTNGAPISSFEK